MPQLLLELLTEEIPARMQAKAQADLERAVMDKLTEAGLMAEGVKAFSGPRRLCVVAEGLPTKSADVKEERKGPKVGAPEKALAGFLRGAGLDSIDQATIQENKKGQFYVAVIEKPGIETTEIIAKMVPEIIREFHWPKSMRWGSGDLRWVRPLQRILCTFDGEVVPFDVDGIASSNVTQGHRVMGPGPFTVRRFEDYSDVLKNKGFVIYDREERKETIEVEANTLCEAQGLELVDDQGLLEEVAGLAEYPVVIMGNMDPQFLTLPPEVITLSMRVHQKYFAVRDPRTGKLAPKFIVVANLKADDGGKTIAAGNSKVLSARLADGVFFWENDKAIPLEERFEALGKIVFHKNLSTVLGKVRNVEVLAATTANLVGGCSVEDAKHAARLSKCDLVSDMVFEFTELEGVMGRYYAMEEGKPQHIADAIRDHYKPKGPSDEVPREPVSVSVALADKLDTLVGFWAIDEKPTGSKDPFALRRAALGVIRLVLENQVRMPIRDIVEQHCYTIGEEDNGKLWIWGCETDTDADGDIAEAHQIEIKDPESLSSDLLSFFADRLKVYLRDKGQRHDLIDAIFALGEDDLVLIVKRVEALASFLETEDGTNLVSGHKRAINILQKEEKRDGSAIKGEIDKKLLSEAAELALHDALNAATAKAELALAEENFEGAMSALSLLRVPVDKFFDDVIVNAEEQEVRENRLKLLAKIRDVTSQVADFSKIEG